MLIDFKDEQFETKIKSEDVSVVQFSAEWCAPCKALIPVMEKLSDTYKDKANFYYADIESGGINTGSAAGVRGVPTVIVYKKGVEVDRKVGGVAESHMKEFLEKNI
jgi:thioredoxin 1|tara:strand:+ start:167 stop:484 length:318 start_codon:yes stop_codon:yes gene_type:complete